MQSEDLVIIEKYERVINYLYPIAQSIPRKHGVVRDLFLRALLSQVELFTAAGKSNQISRLYMADAGLANIRFWLRFLADPNRKLLTQKQHQHSELLVSEVGKILGAWIRKMKGKG